MGATGACQVQHGLPATGGGRSLHCCQQHGGQAPASASSGALPPASACSPLPFLASRVTRPQLLLATERQVGSEARAPHRVQVVLQGRLRGRWVEGRQHAAGGWRETSSQQRLLPAAAPLVLSLGAPQGCARSLQSGCLPSSITLACVPSPPSPHCARRFPAIPSITNSASPRQAGRHEQRWLARGEQAGRKAAALARGRQVGRRGKLVTTSALNGCC